MAKRRRMIRIIPKCPLCNNAEYTKRHVILSCVKLKKEREEIITTIKKYGTFKESNLLYLDTEIKTNEYLKITEFIIDVIKKCGQIISIRK